MGRALLAIAAVLAALLSTAQAQEGPLQPVERNIDIRRGFAVLVRMPSPFFGVIVGDPAIADVVPRSDRLIVVNGRSVGVTNVLALNDVGEPIASVVITVSGQEGSKIYSHAKPRVGEYWAYQCAPICVRVGDPLEGPLPLPEVPRGSVVNITPPVAVVPTR
jgi:Pilus formation protein N terminal region